MTSLHRIFKIILLVSPFVCGCSSKPVKQNQYLNMIYGYWNGSGCRLFDQNDSHSVTLPGTFCEFVSGKGLFSVSSKSIAFYNTSLEKIWERNKFSELHHYVALSPNNELFVLESAEYEHFFKGVVVRTDIILGFDLKGNKTFEWKVLDHLKEFTEVFNAKNLFERHLRLNENDFKLTHFNSLFIIPEDYPHKGPAFKKGNLLVADAMQKGAFIIDRASGKIVWSFKEKDYCCGFHSATLTSRGNFLYFKNYSYQKNKSSQIVIRDPKDNVVLWSYEQKENPQSFHSIYWGAVQELDNKNLLVTINPYDIGKAVEITPDKRIIWEWSNKLRNTSVKPTVFMIKRLNRLDLKEYLPLLED